MWRGELLGNKPEGRRQHRRRHPVVRQPSARSRPIVSRLPVASAKRRTVANDGHTRPPPSRAIPDTGSADAHADWLAVHRRNAPPVTQLARISHQVCAGSL